MGKYDYGTAATGALSGAMVGSSFGPPGMAIGGVIGGVAGLFGSKKKKKKKLSAFDDQQQKLYGETMSALSGKGAGAGMYNFDSDSFNKNFDKTVSNPAYRNFQENIIPNITGQYRQGNLMNSSYSAGALSRAGRDVQENLDAQRSSGAYQGQQQADMNRMNTTQNMLGVSTFGYQQPQQGSSAIDQILGKIGPIAGEWAADYFKRGSSQAPSTTPSPG